MASHQPLHKPDTPALISSLPPQVSQAHPEAVSASQDSNAERLGGHHPQHYSFVTGVPPLQPKPQASPEQTETEPDLVASGPELSSASGADTQPGSSGSPSSPDAAGPSGSGSDPILSLQAQQEWAERFGHHFSKVSVLSPSADSSSPGQVSPDLEISIQSARGGGQALAPDVQTSMGQAFGGIDFSGVRIHTDAQADILNRSISARAFTTGQDVFFRAGEFNPGSRSGQELLAHELTHVVQQSEGEISPQAKLSIGQPGDPYEQEADSMAAQVVQLLSSPPWQREQIQRQLAAHLNPQPPIQRQQEDLGSQPQLTASQPGMAVSTPDLHFPVIQRQETEETSQETEPQEEETQWTSPPLGIPEANGLRIQAIPETHPILTGNRVRYRITRNPTMGPIGGSSLTIQPAGSWVITLPGGEQRQESSSNEIEIELYRTGRWVLEIPVEYQDQTTQTFNLRYEHDVIDPSTMAEDQLAQIPATDFLRFRAGLEMEHLRQTHHTERAGTTPESASTHITSSGSNPVVANNDPNGNFLRYTIHPSRSDARFRWYVVTDEWEGTVSFAQAVAGQTSFGGEHTEFLFYPTQIDGNRVYVSGTQSSHVREFTFPIVDAGTYTLVCDELTPEGEPTGQSAQYVQVILPREEGDQLEAFEQYLENVDENIAEIQDGQEIPTRAVYVNSESGQSMGLSIYLGPSTDNPSRIKLMDLTPGISRIAYEGDSVDGALNAFERENAYPTGVIRMEIPPSTLNTQSIDRELVTDGSSVWSEWAAGTGFASLGLAAAGIALSFVPGGQILAAACFIGAAGTGAVASGLSLYDRLQQAEIDPTGIAIDVLGLVSSILGGVSAFRAIRQTGTVILGTRTGQFLLYSGFATDAVAGVLVTVEGFEQIDQILDSEMSRTEKIGAIARILADLALQGGLLALSVRDLNQARTRIDEQIDNEVTRELPDTTIHTLNLLDDDALGALRGADTNQLDSITDLVRLNPVAATRLIQLAGTQLFTWPPDLRVRIMNLYAQFDPIVAAAIREAVENSGGMTVTRLTNLADAMESRPDVPENFTRGDEFARGGTSALYEMVENPDLLIKPSGGRLQNEARAMVQMEMIGIPTVYVRQTTDNSQSVLILQRIDGVGSKDIIGRSRAPLRPPQNTEVITQRTIDDLENIYSILQANNASIGDFQFIVRRSDGAVFVNDPVSFTTGRGPSGDIRNIIDRFASILRRSEAGE